MSQVVPGSGREAGPGLCFEHSGGNADWQRYPPVPERAHGRKRSGFCEIKWVGGPCFSIIVPGFALRASARIDGGETTAKQPPTHPLCGGGAA